MSHKYIDEILATEFFPGMASQLCCLWGKDDVSRIRPAHFALYLDTVLIFTMHPSSSLVLLANTIWVTLFKHEHIKTDNLLLSYIPKYVEHTAPKLVKVIKSLLFFVQSFRLNSYH